MWSFQCRVVVGRWLGFAKIFFRHALAEGCVGLWWAGGWVLPKFSSDMLLPKVVWGCGGQVF